MRHNYLILATVLAGLASFGTSAASAKDEPIVLEPSSQWNVDFGEAKCRLARTFGADDDLHLLFFETWSPDSGFGFTVSGPQLKRFSNKRKVMVRFHEDQAEWETSPFLGDVDTIGKALIYSSLSLEPDEESDDTNQDEAPLETSLEQLDLELASRVTFASVRQGKRHVIFKTGPLGEAFKIMNDCTSQLMSEWGLDVEQQLASTKRPRWINRKPVVKKIASQYPRSALYRGEQGIMRMRVMIDASGKVTDCVINNATQQQSLESPACKEMQNAHFEPALDAAGEPIDSFYFTSVIYRSS